MMVSGIVLTTIVAAWATKGATDYAPEGSAWVIALIIPCFMTLFASAYFSDKPPYRG